MTEPSTSTNRGDSRYGLLAAFVVAFASMSLAGLSARHLELLWDEQVDHDIAVGLREEPLVGEHPTLDASQTRLPMYACAFAYRLAGRSDLTVSRLVSLIAGGTTIILTFLLGQTLFNSRAGVLAALLLGASPYFLSFARIAMTEGDIFFACFSTAAIWLYVRSLQKTVAVRWVLAGLALALAVGAKFFGIFLIPVFAVLATSTHVARPTPPGRYKDVRRSIMLLTTGMLIVTVTLGGGLLLRPRVDYRDLQIQLASAAWFIAAVILFVFTWHVARRGALPDAPWARLFMMTIYALLAWAVLMPVHMTNPDIVLELARRTLRWDHRVPLALWSDHLRLYSGIALLKQTLPIGILNVIALVHAAFLERTDGRWRPCILSVIYYVVLLCFLPLRQTFYLMGVYPLLMIVTAGFMMDIGARLARIRFSAALIWSLLIVLLLVHQGVALFRSYPYYHLHGYAYTGDRWLGAESRGYRNLIQTPSDGVIELIQWCENSPLVQMGNRVVSFLWEDRILRNVLPAKRRYEFIPRGVTEESDIVPPPPTLAGADFVLLHINNLLGYGDRAPDAPPLDMLSREFEVVHAVRRGPLTVGWVYGRRAVTP